VTVLYHLFVLISKCKFEDVVLIYCKILVYKCTVVDFTPIK